MKIFDESRPKVSGRGLAALLMCLSFAACDPGTSGSGGVASEVVHPVSQDLLSHQTDVVVNRVNSSEFTRLESTRWTDLRRFDDARAIGSLRGDPSLVLGTIWDAEIDSQGQLWVLDGSSNVIRHFDRETRMPLGQLGGEGDGPGELARPVAVAVAEGRDELLVLDAGRYALEIYAVAPGHDRFGEARRTSLRPLYYSRDVCVDGEAIYVTGLYFEFDGRPASPADIGRTTPPEVGLNGAVHRVDSLGNVVASFPFPYARMQDPYLAAEYATASLACRDGWLWVAYSELGEVHAFDEDGRLRWITVIEGLNLSARIEGPSESSGTRVVRRQVPAEGPFTNDVVTHLTLVDSNLLAVQLGSTTFESRVDPPTRRYQTYFLSASDGLAVGRVETDHQVIGSDGTRMTILYREDPFPQLQLVDLEG